jgi:hypothetical protein
MYHLLLLFDGHTSQLITALLRPGNAHTSRGVLSVLHVLVPLLRARWPGVQIDLRADSGCAAPPCKLTGSARDSPTPAG